LSFDPAAPVPKLVLPQRSGLNQNLSQELTRRVKRDGRTVWMGEPQDTEASSESLASFSDAFCVPLGTQEAPQGALHVYARGSHFKKKDLRFAEALADCLNQSLKQLNRQRGLRAENQRLRAGLPPEDAFLGSCPGMVTLRDHLARFAASKARAILIVGESGTGKELVARQLHRTSARADKPFVTVNCAALPRDLVDSHLFGHAKGAFSGATEKHAGFFAEADDGTLFLDEIADLPEGCQAKLLRVIEGYSFRPVGGSEDVEVDVRVVAATNQNIEELVKHGKFRGDLRQRFEVVLSLPPLRERGDDVEELARYFLNKIALEQSREPKFALTEAAVNRLKSFPWPGNIRQLRSAISKAIILCDGDTIDAADFDLVATPESDESRPQSLKLADVKAWAIRRALRQVSGGLARVAAALGINRDTLRKLMIEYGIEKQ
jgi:Nif-specific regulatory protein